MHWSVFIYSCLKDVTAPTCDHTSLNPASQVNHNNSCFSTVTQVVKKRVATHLNSRKHLPDIHQLHCYSATITRQINATWTFATLQLKSPSQQNVGFIAVLTFALTMNNFLFFTSHMVAFFTHPDQKYMQLSGNWQQRKVSNSLQDTHRC